MKVDSKRYAFIVPRYGEKVVGGAETLVRQLAERLSARGDIIEIWTTCAQDNRSWENSLPSGETIEGGVKVNRFLVDSRNLERWIPLQIHISEGMNLAVSDQLDWMQESVNSKGLYEHILENADSFDMLFFGPYLFGTTFWGSMLRPDKSMLVPCLHNESYAYTDVLQSMFRQVRGCIFNAPPEQELARALYGNSGGGAVGMGFNSPEHETIKPYFDSQFPYILYFGRKETGKNVHLLVDFFIAGKDSGVIPAELKLVIAGGGSFSDLGVDKALERDDVLDIGYLSEDEKLAIVANSCFVCQPSVNESFSIVIMEAWQLSIPVVVHADCAVTRYHARQANGGLYFTTPEEFAEVTRVLFSDADLRNSLGTAGKSYVTEEYSWGAVIERFDSVMSTMGV